MAAQVLQYPDQTLREKSVAVDVHNPHAMREARAIIMSLRETMQERDGWGLSAIQLGKPLRIFVAHHRIETKLPLVFINPVVVDVSPETCELREACLSFGFWSAESVSRAKSVTLMRQDEYGRSDTHTFHGWTARIILHEMDHLDGILYTDRVDAMRKRAVDRGLLKQILKRQQRRKAA